MSNAVFTYDYISLRQIDVFTNPPWTGPQIHLYQNDFTPDDRTQLGDFVECTFGGYSALPLYPGPAYPPIWQGTPASFWYPEFWIRNSDPTGVAHGFYITDDNGDLVFSGRFDQPFAFADTVSMLSVWVFISLDQIAFLTSQEILF